MTTGNSPTTQTRRPDRAALVIAAFLAALAGLIFWDSSRLAKIASYSGIGPATIPFVIAGGLLFCPPGPSLQRYAQTFPCANVRKLRLWSGSSAVLPPRCCC
ncbi:hypothetical protein RRH01S_03_00290 [Rhizobium rhizogenes NBRC 13257]|uniref:Uncharacterized protein n=1 Tax=Rhizobium rhizogenes NBRC 13257 TaxID=1220581 RepID=A0AA87U2U0_RHIRH|nr:hypothetical protein RRH01S_03_00290 [Rhizobium rhizogenes NBRC 13257]